MGVTMTKLAARFCAIVFAPAFGVSLTQAAELTDNTNLPRTVVDVFGYRIFDAKTIEASGAANLDDFLRHYVTMNTRSRSNAQDNTSRSGNLSAVNLRGAGENGTLLLLNGRRLRETQFNDEYVQADLNGIPLSAIERIEILPTSAAGVYGAGAVGGAVNVVLKRHFEGGELRTVYRNPLDNDAPIQTVYGTYGMSFEEGRTQFMIAGQYSDMDSLQQRDRLEMLDRNIGAITRNQPSLLYSAVNPVLGSTPNIVGRNNTFTSPTPMPLALKDGRVLGSAITYVPAGISPSTAFATLYDGLFANASLTNTAYPSTAQAPRGLLAPYGATTYTRSAYATVRREMTSNLELFAEYFYDTNDSSVVNNALNTDRINVPVTAPSNPFQQAVSLRVPDVNLAQVRTLDAKQQRVTGGFIARSGEWQARAEYSYSKNENALLSYQWDTAGLNFAIASGQVNPFVDTAAYSIGLQNFLAPVREYGVGYLRDATLRIAGPIGAFSWGSPLLTVEAGRRKWEAGVASRSVQFPVSLGSSSQTTYSDYWANTSSAYAEIALPLVTEKNATAFAAALSAQLAVRYEKADINTAIAGTNDSFTEPMFGLRYKPVEPVTLRASISSGYALSRLRAPSAGATGIATLTDPTSGAFVVTQITLNPSSGFAPHNSDAWNAGLSFEPTMDLLGRLRLSLDYFDIEQTDLPRRLSVQETANLESWYPDLVQRDSLGNIVNVILTDVGVEKRRTRGVDFELSNLLDTSWGKFQLNTAATRILNDERQTFPGAVWADYLNYINNGGPGRFKANSRLSWERAGWMLGWNARYYGSYEQAGFATVAQGSPRISSQIYHDMDVGYTFAGERRNLFLSGMALRLGVQNVFDAEPPFDAAMPFYNYVSTLGDARLRSYYVSLRKGF